MTESETLIRIEEMVEAFKRRARANERTFEQEVEWLLARKQPLTPEERVAVVTYNHAYYNGIQPSLTAEEIREGLM